MRTQEGSGVGLFGWGRLLAVLGLLFCVLAPSAVGAQGIKGGADEATEEATEEVEDNGSDELTEFIWEDWEDVGMTAEDSYESPQFGVTLDWSRDWAVDIFYNPPVISDEDNELDQVYLLWSDGDGAESYLIVAIQSAGRGGPDADVEEWTDPDYIEDQWDPNFDVEAILDDTTNDAGAVLYSLVDTDNDDAQYYTIYQSIELEDGTMIYLSFSSYEDWFEDAYTSWSEDLELDGAPVDLVFTWADIEDAL